MIKKLVTPSHFALTFFIVLGLILAILIPPFQKPDEDVHFFRTVAIANGDIICNPQSYPIQRYLQQFINDSGTYDLKFNFWNKIHYQRLLNDGLHKDIDRSIMRSNVSLCVQPTLSYFPQALGVSAALAFGLPPLVVFYIGRLTMLAVAALVFTWLIKRVPKQYLGIVLLFFCLPMTIHQITSYSYDAVLLLASASLFVFFVRLLEAKKVLTSDLMLLAISLSLIVLTKDSGYELLLVLPVIIIMQQKVWRSAQLLSLSLLVIIIPGLILTAPKIRQLSAVLSAPAAQEMSAIDLTASRAFVNPAQQMAIITHYPIETARLFLNASITNQDTYIKGLIGIFGWLDYEISTAVISIILVIVGIVILQSSQSKTTKTMTPLSQVLLLCMLVGTYVLIQFGLYLYWMPVGVTGIEGVQGRYFLPLFPFALLLISQAISKRNTRTLLLVAMVVAGVLSISGTIINRYYYTYRVLDYDTSKSLASSYNPDESGQILGQVNQAGKKLIGFKITTQLKEPISLAKHLYLDLEVDPECSQQKSFHQPISINQVLAEKDVLFFVQPVAITEKGVCFKIRNAEFPLVVEPELLL